MDHLSVTNFEGNEDGAKLRTVIQTKMLTRCLLLFLIQTRAYFLMIFPVSAASQQVFCVKSQKRHRDVMSDKIELRI